MPALLTLALAKPGHCGYWKLSFEVKGKSKSVTPNNGAWGAVGTNRSHVWDAKDAVKQQDGTITFTENAGSDLLADYRDEGPAAVTTVESSGSISPVFTWITKSNLQDDPPSSVLRYWERGVVSAGDGGATQHYPTYSNTVKLSMDNVVAENNTYNRSLSAEGYTTIPNAEHAPKLYGPTRSLSATGQGETPWNKFAGLSHGCGIFYAIRFGMVTGEANINLFREDQSNGHFYKLFPDGGSADVNPIVGGRIWVGLELKVGHKSHLDPNIKSMSIRIKEEEDQTLGSEQHSVAENHIDVPLSLRPGDGDATKFKWQKREGFEHFDNNGWEETTEPLNTSGGTQGVQYRVLWAWDSYRPQTLGGTKLWAHNISHTVSLAKINGKPFSGTSAQRIEFLPDAEIEAASYPVAKVSPRQIDIRNNYTLTFLDTVVAAGAKEGDTGHEARFKIKFTSGDNSSGNGFPLEGIQIAKPKIVLGGHGPREARSAKVVMTSPITNEQGEAFGKLLSGNRVEDTKIGLQHNAPHPIPEESQAEVTQVWNEESDPWTYEPYFDFDVPSTISYKMSFQRTEPVPITGHSLDPTTTMLSGLLWNPDAGEDWDEDGFPDGDYEEQNLSLADDPVEFALRSNLIEWGNVSELNGTYTVHQTIRWDDEFIVDWVEFWMYDDDAYGPDGVDD